MKKQGQIYEGKAKRIFTTDDPKILIMSYRDDAVFSKSGRWQTARLGAVNNNVSNILFRLLKEKGIPTHFIEQLSERETAVKSVKIFPLRIIVRNMSAGSFAERYGIEEGVAFEKPTFEVLYKNEALGDPLMCEDHAVALGLATEEQLAKMRRYALAANDALKEFFGDRGLALADFSLEFGIYEGQIIVADEISPDTCRLWDLEAGDGAEADIFRREPGSEKAVLEIYERIGGGRKQP